MNFQSIYRKTYLLELEVHGLFGKPRKKKVYYKQGTLAEILRMVHFNETGDVGGWVRSFLLANGVSKFEMRKMRPNSHQNIYEILVNTFAKGFISKEKAPEPNITDEKFAPIYAGIASILAHTGETMNTLLQLTWEQIEFLIKGVKWNALEAAGKHQENVNDLMMENDRAIMSDAAVLEFLKANEKHFSK